MKKFIDFIEALMKAAPDVAEELMTDGQKRILKFSNKLMVGMS